MNRSEAESTVLDHALSISPDQFEQLCRILIKESEPTRELELTPHSGDAGIDVHAVVDRDLFQIRLGLQAKRNDPDNTISSGKIRKFKGSLEEGEYHVGTFVTTSSFTDPAIESAEKGNVRLVDGEKLAEMMITSKIGVQTDDESHTIDWDFWELFQLERNSLVLSEAIPQANDIEKLNIVLKSMDNGKTVKPEIHPVLENQVGETLRERQTDYYAAAGWALGFVHKDTDPTYDGIERQSWTLSSIGKEYVRHLDEGWRASAEDLLHERIRQMEITKRVIEYLKEDGTMTHKEMEEVIIQNTPSEDEPGGLSDGTCKRRAKTMARWIEILPEVNRSPPKSGKSHHIEGSTYRYNSTDLTDF